LEANKFWPFSTCQQTRDFIISCLLYVAKIMSWQLSQYSSKEIYVLVEQQLRNIISKWIQNAEKRRFYLVNNHDTDIMSYIGQWQMDNIEEIMEIVCLKKKIQ